MDITFINSMHEIAELLDSKKDGLILEQVKLLVISNSGPSSGLTE